MKRRNISAIRMYSAAHHRQQALTVQALSAGYIRTAEYITCRERQRRGYITSVYEGIGKRSKAGRFGVFSGNVQCGRNGNAYRNICRAKSNVALRLAYSVHTSIDTSYWRSHFIVTGAFNLMKGGNNIERFFNSR